MVMTAVVVLLNIATFGFAVLAPLVKSDRTLNLFIGLAIVASMLLYGLKAEWALVWTALIAVIRQAIVYFKGSSWGKKELVIVGHFVAVFATTAVLMSYNGWASGLSLIDTILCAYGFVLLTGLNLRLLTLTHGIIWTTIGVGTGVWGVAAAAFCMVLTSLWAIFEILTDKAKSDFKLSRAA